MVQLIKTRMTEGFWHAEVLEPSGQPEISARFDNSEIENIEVTQGEQKNWVIKVPVPAAMLSDGAHTAIVSLGDGSELARFSIIAGDPVPEDLRGEISMLRAELDLLKKAFRRHCQETMN